MLLRCVEAIEARHQAGKIESFRADDDSATQMQHIDSA